MSVSDGGNTEMMFLQKAQNVVEVQDTDIKLINL